MNNTDPTNTATRYITSLCRHARKHGLGNTMGSIKPPQHATSRPYVQLFPYVDEGHLAVFARWLPTLTDPVVTVTADDGENLHLLATGGMDDRTVTGVVALVDGAERDLVEVNCHPVKGNTIPVELLLSLVSAEAAESRTDETALAGVS